MVKGQVSASPMAKAALGLMDPKKLIESCGPGVKHRFRLLMIGLALLGYGRVRVSSTRRSLEEQQRIYAKGRDSTECRMAGVPKEYSDLFAPTVSWCRPAESKHVQGRAIDVSFAAYNSPMWCQIGCLADDLGLEWGGEWSVRDYGHFEI